MVMAYVDDPTATLSSMTGGSGSAGASSPASAPGYNGDPNAVVTNPSVPNFNIQDVFKSFGYYPTQDEVSAIAGSFQGKTDPGQIGTSAVAQYVTQKRAEITRHQNDPLVALQKRMQDSVDLMKSQVQGLYGQLQDTLGSAPQLFGGLTPDQINEYLAPLQTSFDKQLADVQGTMASRGLAASSTENNAIAQTGEQFKENVLASGLQVGMQSQKDKANAIQAQINNLFGLTGTEEGIVSGAAKQKSDQDLGQSNLIASLPYFLSQDAFAKQQALNASQGGGTPWGSIAGTIIGGGLGAFGGPAGAAAGASIGGSIGGSFDKNSNGSGATFSSGSSNALFLASLMRNKSGPSAGDKWANSDPNLFANNI